MSEFADLAAELREAGIKLDRVDTAVTELSAWASEAGPRIEDQESQLRAHQVRLAEDSDLLAEIRKDLNTVLEELPRQPKLRPIDWRTLPAEDAEKIWLDLGEWVDQELVQVYSVSRELLPDCWPLHPAAVRHVSWLWTLHQHAYLKHASPLTAAEWNTRWHHDALKEVKNSILRDAVSRRKARCGLGTHFGKQLPGSEQLQERLPPDHQPPPRVPAAVAGPPPGAPGYGQQAAAPPWQQQPQATPPFPPPAQPAGESTYSEHDPKSALALRELWWPNLLHAREEDVARRREAERAQQQS
ncbi:hypothetical protein [Amycolatopsis sacchari]|uniref:hypothetical protein n=1 Tax=Amycolatopsis sacchari TaxID=115433 RepID=UPI003D704C00